MKLELTFLNDWRIWIGIVSAFTLLFNVLNLMVTRHVTNKITKNDLKHLTKDVDALKVDNKEVRVDINGNLGKIFRRLGKIEKAVDVQGAICNERHPKKS